MQKNLTRMGPGNLTDHGWHYLNRATLRPSMSLWVSTQLKSVIIRY